jgi:hypothetical protein
MTKELFIKTIKALEIQLTCDIDFSHKIGAAFPDAFTANLLPNNHILTLSIFNILEEEFNDKENKWINWFCYDINFGKDHLKLIARYKDGTIISMKTSSDLYEFLINNK